MTINGIKLTLPKMIILTRGTRFIMRATGTATAEMPRFCLMP